MTSIIHTRALKIQTLNTTSNTFEPVKIYSEKEALVQIIDAKQTNSLYTCCSHTAKNCNLQTKRQQCTFDMPL